MSSATQWREGWFALESQWLKEMRKQSPRQRRWLGLGDFCLDKQVKCHSSSPPCTETLLETPIRHPESEPKEAPWRKCSCLVTMEMMFPELPKGAEDDSLGGSLTSVCRAYVLFTSKPSHWAGWFTFSWPRPRSPGKMGERILGLGGTCQRETEGEHLAQCPGYLQSSANFISDHSFMPCFLSPNGRGDEGRMSFPIIGF